jgi:hypothetical protein
VKKLYIYYIFLIPVLLFTGCNQGISPASVEEEQQKSGFSGKITFSGNWPDSVKWTLLVVFKDPLVSAASFNVFNVGYISHPIPSGTVTYNYSTEKDTGYLPIGAGSYSYIVVAQSNNPVLSINRADWKVIGIYYANGDTTQPGKLEIPQNSIINNINIKCDFNNPPPQPPGGN